MQYPKLSIITPSFNQGQYIEQTILSVLDQGYPNLEYIIIDGGSTDNTVDILKKYNGQITYWVSEPDKGQSDAINKGFQKATGEIINWINSDDYYAKNTFVNLADSFANKGVKSVATVVHNFEEGGNNWNEQMVSYKTNHDFITKTLVLQPGTFFRKEVWDRYFPVPPQLRFTMDQYLWFCFWLEHGVHQYKSENYITASFRRHAGSKTSSSSSKILFYYLSPPFFNEYNLIFWSFFKDRNPVKADILASYFFDDFDYQSRRISFPPHLTIEPGIEEKIFQPYLFAMLTEDFNHGYFDRLKTNLNYLQLCFLDDHEKKRVRKMKGAVYNQNAFRTYRRLYWKFKSTFKRN